LKLDKSEKSYDIYGQIREKFENTIIHFEGVIIGRNINQLYDEFKEKLRSEGFNSSLLAFRFVKSFGPKMWHLVLDIIVGI
ncbi:MAG: hypothetical protein ACTSWY_14670, partial [Promethearchaeota archaeon]